MGDLVVSGISKHYKNKNPNVEGKLFKALDQVSFTLEEGQVLGVIGQSGSGKSTLGKIIVGLEDASEGQIYFDGELIQELRRKDRLKFHKTIQIVFQNPYETFDYRHTILRIMSEPLKIHHIGNSDADRKNMVIRILEEGGITPAVDYLGRYPHQLSGGQLQRISILRAMSLEPDILIADEPVSMLDVSIRGEIIKMLTKLIKKKKKSLIFISHDIATTQFLSDQLIVMNKGKVVEQGLTNQVIYSPQEEYTKLLISSIGSIDPRKGIRARREKELLEVIK
ncbi:ABC transporter ATP-binding protein [Facklamia languida]|uniref:ABC transporter domain-containing protein n=1 Tax=Facklamia languida CCUG 37842 TaxID=883113 RepID=H3NIG0_9LACT|nr:ABC transporter ATP-binding protein [Facklamia languida]EHR37470.1 hypothetical protein HMPREF9708_00649 [Facklamia languida CCUG 37842]